MRQLMAKLAALVLVSLLAHGAEAQQAKKVYRVDVLQRSTLPESFLEAFKRGLR
jgi:hypothetical protein